MPPQWNATVTKVTGAAVADDWDRAPTAGADKWTGEARAYYRERIVEEVGDQANVFTRRELILDVHDVIDMALDTDDVLTFTVDALGGPFTGKATTIPRPTLAVIPPGLQTSRIILADA